MLNRDPKLAGVLVAALVTGLSTAAVAATSTTDAPGPVAASDEGRTDGPEGSEIGHGGYSRAGGFGRISLAIDWGAAVSDVDRGPPMFGGLTLAYWFEDWIQLEGSGLYVGQTDAWDVLIGPRFRSTFYPLSASFSFKAGGMVLPDLGLRFAISPQVGVDALIRDTVLLGLGYAIDIPVDEEGTAQRIFMTVGWRF